MLGLRRRLTDAGHDLDGARDLRRLRARHPEFVPSATARADAARELRPAYDDYIATVSTAAMASSFETSCYLLCLCRAAKPELAVDLGSGFSSYVFRRYAQQNGARVISVDDSAEWLEKTADFLRSHDAGTDDLLEWESFRAAPPRDVDIVFHDLAGGELREVAMPVATSLLGRKGIVVFDDAHHRGHRARMQEAAEAADFDLLSLRRLTLDGFRRWAMLAVRG